ncbi:MAG: hypothetical protein JWM11_4974 [Planctomycetaceae bacterium]|nr:hypothetical protein [Planctomycetaceae bacterium]
MNAETEYRDKTQTLFGKPPPPGLPGWFPRGGGERGINENCPLKCSEYNSTANTM